MRRWVNTDVVTARDRRRPGRRIPTVAVFLATTVAGAGCSGTVTATGSGTSASSASSAAGSGTRTVARAALPTADNFTAMDFVGGRLVLSGSTNGGRCQLTSARADPSTLALGPVALTSCDQPDFAGQRAAADLRYDPTTTSETFSVATRAGSGGIETGPVLERFAAPAGAHPLTTSADGSIWVWGSPLSGAGSQVTELSASTGSVEETVSLPHGNFGTPLMAADDDGLWLSLPPNTQDTAPTPVYFVAAGQRTVRVMSLPARAGWWMVAQGHQVWIDTLSDSGPTDVLWTAKGPGGSLVRLGPVAFPAAAQDGDNAAAGGTGGLWTFVRQTSSPPSPCRVTQAVDVVRVIPGQTPRPVAALDVPVTGCNVPLPYADAVVERAGRLYFLLDGAELYRVKV
jgi:hypothetical protein